MEKLIFFMILSIINCGIAYGGNLSGVVVVLDPGHGGRDPGGKIHIDKKMLVCESGYSYDVALRLEKILKEEGAIVFRTCYSNREIINDTLGLIRPNNEAKFTLDSSIVKNDSIGLNKRVLYATKIKNEYKSNRIIYLAIHFDVISSKYHGARIVTVEKNLFVNTLINEFKTKGCFSPYSNSVLISGNGYKNIFVLKHLNFIADRVLLELGNICNRNDLLKMRNPSSREDYAHIINSALLRYINFK
jgi:N-acetylmuramoyl-L-alanine amidase